MFPVRRPNLLAMPKDGSGPVPSGALTKISRPVIKATPLRDPRAPFSPKVPGDLSRVFDRKGVRSSSFVVQQRERGKLTQADMRARFKAAPRVVLDQSKPTGWDWIRRGRLADPRAAGGRRGLMRRTRKPAAFGVKAQQQEIPETVSVSLAQQGAITDALGPNAKIPLSTETTPTLTSAPDLTDQGAGKAPGVGGGSMLYIGAAVFVVFLIMRKG